MRESVGRPLLFFIRAARTMAADVQAEVTTLLNEVRTEKPGAVDRLVAVVYAELRGHAARLMEGERADHTLQPTALLNEAFARLLTADVRSLAADRRLFFGAA